MNINPVTNNILTSYPSVRPLPANHQIIPTVTSLEPQRDHINFHERVLRDLLNQMLQSSDDPKSFENYFTRFLQQIFTHHCFRGENVLETRLLNPPQGTNKFERLIAILIQLHVNWSFKEASTSLDQLLDSEPNFTLALNLKGECIARLQNEMSALPFFERVLTLDTNNLHAMTAKATILKDETLLKEILNKYPNNFYALVTYSKILKDRGNEAESILNIMKAVNISLSNYSLFELLNCFMHFNRFYNAIVFFNQLPLRAWPAQILIQVAECYFELGNKDEAEKFALQAIGKTLNLRLGYELLFWIYYEKKEYKKAIACGTMNLSINQTLNGKDPQNFYQTPYSDDLMKSLYRALAECYSNVNREEKALAFLLKAQQLEVRNNY